ncbi:hypothetical protein [Streptomyces sp. NPDC048659]|uniref:hypothetical protein n=1 Tax=Streptomyces sp. NPDC048659 TaxID=3155489 RepID=UPI003435361D
MRTTTSTGRAGTAPALLPALVLALLLVVSCGGWSPAAAAPGPRPGEPQPRVLAAAPAPYETAPAQHCENSATHGRAAARHQGRRCALPHRAAPCPADHAELRPVPLVLEQSTTDDDGAARTRRHHAHGPDVAHAQSPAPAALQVFRC